MTEHRVGRPLTNEIKYPYIVELAVTGKSLGVALSRRVIDFHKARQIQPRHGRCTILKRKGKTHYRWCFSDIETARAFIGQFGGTIKQK
jgi:hypothetical protein